MDWFLLLVLFHWKSLLESYTWNIFVSVKFCAHSLQARLLHTKNINDRWISVFNYIVWSNSFIPPAINTVPFVDSDAACSCRRTRILAAFVQLPVDGSYNSYFLWDIWSSPRDVQCQCKNWNTDTENTETVLPVSTACVSVRLYRHQSHQCSERCYLYVLLLMILVSAHISVVMVSVLSGHWHWWHWCRCGITVSERQCSVNWHCASLSSPIQPPATNIEKPIGMYFILFFTEIRLITKKGVDHWQ
jgi:hypothetical protein